MASSKVVKEVWREFVLYQESSNKLDSETKDELALDLVQACKSGILNMFTTAVLISGLYGLPEGLYKFHDLVPRKDRVNYYNGLADRTGRHPDWLGLS